MNFDKELETTPENTTQLTKAQKRLVQSVTMMLDHVLKTESEEDFFESSTELFRLVATAIKKSNFPQANNNEIAYDKQVLEFCSDVLADQVYGDDVLKYDN